MKTLNDMLEMSSAELNEFIEVLMATLTEEQHELVKQSNRRYEEGRQIKQTALTQ